MKAKDYAEMFHRAREAGDTPQKAIFAVFQRLLKEADELRVSRNVMTDSASAAILREQSTKWRALARLVPGIEPDGFYNAVMESLKQQPEQIAALKRNGFTR